MGLDEEVKKILREGDKPAPVRYVFKLPCGHGSQEVTHTGDQVIVCSVCLKRHLLIWSKIGRHKFSQ